MLNSRGGVASVSLRSSLIFPEPQAHIDYKNLVTVCLFGRYLVVKVLSRMGSIVLLKEINLVNTQILPCAHFIYVHLSS